MELSDFIHLATKWAQDQPGICLLALVGSHARGAARPDSDIDLVILTTHPEDYLHETGWTAHFGKVERTQLEDWGRVTSLRAWYQDGMEVEFGFSTPDWAADAEDEGTREVVEDGIWILYSSDERVLNQIDRLRRIGEDD